MIANNLYAQNYFINTYQYKNFTTVFNGVINQSDTLIISGFSYECLDSSTCYQGFYISMMDTLGQILKDTVILAPHDDIVAENTPILCSTSDNGYFLVGELLHSHSSFIVKLKSNFEVEFTKEFKEDGSQILSVRNRGIVFLKDYYYILSIKQHSNFQRITHLLKIDNLGNLIWDKPFSKQGDASVTFKLSKDGNIMIFGQRAKLNNENKIDIKQWCFYVDTSGSVIKEHESDWMTNKLSGYFDIVELDPGYLVSTSNYIYDSDIAPYPKNQIVLEKVNDDFDPEWSITYGDTSTINSIRNIRPLGNGYFIGTGNYVPFPDHLENSVITTLTIKFDELGKIIWDRLDSILYEPMYGCRNVTAETIILNSGSIISNGYTDRSLLNQGSIGFLSKLDSNGCILPMCPHSVGIDEDKILNESITIYPNPVKDELRINIKNQVGTFENCRVHISNGIGVNILMSDIVFNDGIATTNLNTLPSGIYIIQISVGNKKFVSKLMKY